MNRWLKREQIGKIYFFVGKQVVVLCFLSFICGLTLFAVEFAFAFSMQLLLAVLGISKMESVSGPSWFRDLSLGQTLFLFSALVACRGLIQWLQMYVQNAAYVKFVHRQKSRILDRVFHSDSANTGETLSNFSEVANNAGASMIYIQAVVYQVVISILMGASLMWILPIPTVVAGVCLVIFLLPLRGLYRSMQASGTAMQVLIKQSTGRLILSLRNLLFLNIYSLQKKENEEQQRLIARTLESQLSHYRILGFTNIVPQLTGIVIVCIIVFVMHESKNTTSTLLLSYFYLFFRFLQNVAVTSQTYTSFSFYLPFVETLGKWWLAAGIDRPTLSRNDSPSIPLRAQLPLGWKISNVTFSYPGSNRKIFSNLSLSIPPGSTFAVIGESGAGKSTLVSLLLDQKSPDSGEIQILDADGDVQSLSQVRGDFLKLVGYVGPEPFIFDGTIRENLMYGLINTPSDVDIRSALHRAECHFIKNLEMKLEHRITDQGSGLSAGQKQRISLARALLRNPAVLVLDEATSNLDSRTEKALIETLRSLKKQITIIIVTHRESLLVLADEIFELKEVPQMSHEGDKNHVH